MLPINDGEYATPRPTLKDFYEASVKAAPPRSFYEKNTTLPDGLQRQGVVSTNAGGAPFCLGRFDQL